MTVIAATSEAIAEAAGFLRSGRLVAFPTETVYGLGADATNARAVAAVYEAKGRPRFNPLIVHVPSMDAVSTLGHLTDAGRKLAAAFWPGPLTLVLAKRTDCPVADLTTAGLDTIAVRIPAHPVGRALLEAAKLPIAAPSANRSGHVSPTMAAHVATDLGDKVAMILDGGATPVGLESTVIDVTGNTPVILRLGGIEREDIARVLGCDVRVAGDENVTPSSPGMLARHYAPATKLRLDARDVRHGEALLAFGSDVPRHAGPTINLSPSGDLVEAAANLFAALRTLDAAGATTIAVTPIPAYGLGEAMNDRLKRAARAEWKTPRDCQL
jgi:L-threonylcarbamoyladenylate synthase